MTTTENTADRSITLPLAEVSFLLDLGFQLSGTARLNDDDTARLESLLSIANDTDMPAKPEVFLLVKEATTFGSMVVRAFASEAEAIRTMNILNEFSSDVFEVQSVVFEP